MLSTEERTWQNAPQSVRIVRVLAILSLIGNGLGLLLFLLMLVGSHGGQVFAAIMLAFIGLMSAFQLWMLGGLREGRSYAYNIQMVISFLGVAGGNILYGYILYLWFKPETRAWFSV